MSYLSGFPAWQMLQARTEHPYQQRLLQGRKYVKKLIIIIFVSNYDDKIMAHLPYRY